MDKTFWSMSNIIVILLACALQQIDLKIKVWKFSNRISLIVTAVRVELLVALEIHTLFLVTSKLLPKTHLFSYSLLDIELINLIFSFFYRLDTYQSIGVGNKRMYNLWKIVDLNFKVLRGILNFYCNKYFHLPSVSHTFG